MPNDFRKDELACYAREGLNAMRALGGIRIDTPGHRVHAYHNASQEARFLTSLHIHFTPRS